MSILFCTFVVQIRNISQTSKKQKIMIYKEAKKIQGAIYDLDDINEESSVVAAVEKHTYNNDYSVYIYGRPHIWKSALRAASIANTLNTLFETIAVRDTEYNAGTSDTEMVTAWELF